MSTREPAQVIESVRAHFVERYGREPAGVWSAPGRVNLIGEHTDYNGGLCLPIALPHRTYAAAAVRDDGVLRVCSLQSEAPAEVALDDVSPERPGGWASYVAGVLWALRREGHDVPGLDVVIDSVVPVGAGLSSSAALECSVGAAVSDLAGLGLLDDADARARLAQACIRAENEIAGAPTGGMDQSAALLCDDATALLLDCRSWQTEPVPFDLASAGYALLVTDTRAHHELVDGQYAARRDACEEAARILGVGTLREVPASGLEAALDRLPTDEMRRRVRHVVTEIDRVERAVAALRAGDLDEVGRLFDASHASMRDDYEISCDELDVATDTARRLGALGARMTGGGFGGSCIAIVRADAVDEVSQAIDAAFAERGFTAPSSFAVTAGSSAHRDA
ncbi:galactokinase [Intrasporangium sp. YIM S08009]|uniref:galactokinase n=1 Tax=Intrasporangium zincisolvens TaxID=3080018 RepID=UPI002B055C6F|nr:galactokinase [Intrasporangium sp. YIM S08009]